MFLLDNLLVFVLDKIAAVADQELNDPDRQKERLLEAQARYDLGEIDEAELKAIEADVFARIREIRARTEPLEVPDRDHRIAGIEITMADETDESS